MLATQAIKTTLQRQRASSQVSLRKRLVRGISQEKKAELKKSATAVSFRPKLQRLIKEGKTEQIVSTDPHSKANLFYNNHAFEIQKQLASTKKSFSTMVLKTRAKDQSITLIKNQITRAQKQIHSFKVQDNSITKQHTNTLLSLEDKKQLLEGTQWEYKCYQHVKTRLSEDELISKARHERLNAQLEQERSISMQLEKSRCQLQIKIKRLSSILQEAREIANKKTSEKNELIYLMNEDINERGLLDELKADKHRKQGLINEIAPSFIEQEELQKMLEILSTHRMLSQIIKTKSVHLISEYEEVHRAYTHIKSHSNINECDKILRRMEEHDALYDGALKRATALELELTSAEALLKLSLRNKEEILSKEGVNKQWEKGYYQGNQKDKYQLILSEKTKLMEKMKNDEVLRRNIQGWGKGRLKQLSIEENNTTDFITCLTDLTIKIQQRI